MDELVAFLNARLDEEEPAEVCGCLDTNHWPPCSPQPWKDRKRREIAAIRAIMELHKPELIEAVNADGDERSGVFCGECSLEVFPCATVRQLGAIWSDHPGYLAAADNGR